ncbi:hypothetical protein [Sinorhizobium fredii]|uniref:hypothetical protein n=1 Tax=Rhizobium fredii TaxID=380 RepID=UPI003397D5E1
MEPVAETLLSDTAFCEDIVWGLENIGKIIGQKPHQVHYMLRNGQLPGGQLGKNQVVFEPPRLEAVHARQGCEEGECGVKWLDF